MAKTPTDGRPSLYRGKSQRYRVQGVLSNEGGEIFERVRARLAKQIARERGLVSDADVIERAVREYDKRIGSV